MTGLDFLQKFYLPHKVAKLTKNMVGFLNLLKNLFYNKDLCYLLCSYTNPIFGKPLVPEIWVKVLSANQIAGFLNQLYPEQIG